jgi:hypothetical protein
MNCFKVLSFDESSFISSYFKKNVFQEYSHLDLIDFLNVEMVDISLEPKYSPNETKHSPSRQWANL